MAFVNFPQQSCWIRKQFTFMILTSVLFGSIVYLTKGSTAANLGMIVKIDTGILLFHSLFHYQVKAVSQWRLVQKWLMQLLPKLFPQMPIAIYIRFEKLLKSANNKCIARGIGTDRSILLICHPKCPSLTHSWTNVRVYLASTWSSKLLPRLWLYPRLSTISISPCLQR